MSESTAPPPPSVPVSPHYRLAAEPALESVADVDRGLFELAYLENVEGRANADCKQQIATAKQECADRLFVPVDGKPMAIADRRKALENAILDFCDRRYRDVLDGVKGKTRKLTHGEVAWKRSRAKLGFLDGATPDEVLAIADESAPQEAGLAASVLKLLQKIKITPNLTAAMLCKVDVKLDAVAVWKAYQAGAISIEDLEEVLLTVVKSEEYVSLKIYGYDVESQPSAAA